jgi:hypothetical protein
LSTNSFLLNSIEIFDTSWFLDQEDYSLIEGIAENPFVTSNMEYLFIDLSLVSSGSTNSRLSDLSNFFVVTLCKYESLILENQLENIFNISPGDRSAHRLYDAVCELEVQYDEDAFISPVSNQDIATPDSKLYYPEPFIASPSFTHEEI